MAHIDTLTKHQLEQEIGLFSQQRDLAHGLGMRKTVKAHTAYLDALWAQLKVVDPRLEVNEDFLMMALLVPTPHPE